MKERIRPTLSLCTPGSTLLRAGMLLLLLCAPLPAVANTEQQVDPVLDSQRQEGNLLANGGFEEGFYNWNGINELHLAEGWVPWWIENAEHQPTYFRPEYKEAEAVEFPQRVRSGSSAQQWFKLHSSFYAGIYQHVSGVIPEEPYRFSMWAQVWSSSEDNPPDVSTVPANPHLQIGIDPTGNIDPFSVDIIWSHEAPMNEVIDGWSQLTVQAVAKASAVTVFVRTRPDFANKHNNIYLDDASLESALVTTEGTAVATASEEAPLESSTGAPPELPDATATAAATSPVQPATLQPVDTATATEEVAATEEVVATAEQPVLLTPQLPTSTPESEERTAPPPSPLPTDVPAPQETEAVVTAEPLPQTEVTVAPDPSSTTPAQGPAPTNRAEATEVAAANPTSNSSRGAPLGEVQDDSPAVNLVCVTPLLGIALLVPVLILIRRRGRRSQLIS